MFKLTTSLARSAFSAFRPAAFFCVPKFNFSTNAGRNAPPPAPKEPKRPALKDQVESEIKFERDNVPENVELLEVLQKSDWTVTSNGLFHELSRKFGDKSVNVTFFSRSPSAANENENENEEQQQEGEEQQSPPDFFEFTVYVRKGNNPDALFADFIVADGQISMSSLSFTGDYDSHKTQGKMERPQTTYQGPDLETLDEALLDSLTNYFEGLGINEDVVNFIEQYSLNTEHAFYVKWLEQLKQYV